MSSSRKFSVRRHIKNYNIHNGIGQVVTFVEYSVGRREGKYQPQGVSQFTKSKAHFLDRILDEIMIEVKNQIVKEIAGRIYRKLPTNHRDFDMLETKASEHISKNISDEFLSELRKILFS
jgi:hypothetical protein